MLVRGYQQWGEGTGGVVCRLGMAVGDVICHKPGLPASSWDLRKGQRQVAVLTCQKQGGDNYRSEQ